MAVFDHRFVFVFLVMAAAGPGVAAECTADEVQQLTSCIATNNSQVFSVFGNNTTTCNRSQISSDICGAFSLAVTCINSKPISNVTCRPNVVAQIDENLGPEYPCKYGDFVAVCPDAPRINQGNKNGSRREVVTLSLLMTSLMATFVVTVLSTGGR